MRRATALRGTSTPRIKMWYVVKITTQLKPRKPPRKLDPGFSRPAPKTTLEEISNAVKMTALHTKDGNVVEGQNGHPPESPKTAVEKAGFEPGESGNPSGLKQRGQNDLTAKPNETAKKVGEQVGKSAKTTALILIQMLVFYH